MKKVSRSIALLLAALLLVSVFSGCGPSGGQPTGAPGNNTPPPEGGDKPYAGVTVEWASCFNEAEAQAVWMSEMAAQWSEISGAEVKFNFAGRDVLTSVKSDILVGNAPDVIDNDGSELEAALMSSEEILLEPLTDLYDRPAYGESTPLRDNLNGAYSLLSRDGVEYIIPFIYVTSGFFYNKTLFKELNLEIPKTWDEFLAVCDAIEASGIPALAADGNISFYNCYYYQILCQRILGSGKFLEAALDKTGAAWDDPGFLKAAQLVSQLSAAGANYFQDGYAGSAYPAAQSDWAMGGAGMLYCGTWIPLETSSLTDADWEYGFFGMPAIEGGAGKTTDIEAQMMSFCVPKDAKNKEAAKDLLAYMLSKKSCDRMVELNDNIAARTDSIYPEALAEVKPIIDASESYYKNYDGAMSAAPEWWANVFYPADDALFFGNITPEAFIEQIKSESIKFYANK